MTVLAVVLLIALLICLISWARLPPFAAFIATALIGALYFGMPLAEIGKSLERGIGDMLGGLTAIICLGAMFGRIIADSGAARCIAQALVGAVGMRFILVALALTGLIVGIALFYAVGFVVLVPLIFTFGARTKLPAVQLGIPLLCGLSIAHGFLPPHPSPVALIKVFGADTGLTLMYGVIVGGVTLMVAGPMLALTLGKIAPRGADRAMGSAPAPAGASARPKASDPPTAFGPSDASGASDERLPQPFNSCLAALAPVMLIAAATAVAYIPGGSPQLKAAITFIGQPTVALMLSLIYATLTLGVARGMRLEAIMRGYGESLRDVAAILLVLAGAGALKQVFVDTGINTQLAVWLQTVPVHPLILGWLIAMAIRVALGSATIAGLTAAGIMAPVVGISHVNPSLMVLSIGAGSLMCSHVNDAGFWLFKEYFDLDLRDTFRSWTLMESVAGIVGLVCVLGLNLILSLLGRP